MLVLVILPSLLSVSCATSGIPIDDKPPGYGIVSGTVLYPNNLYFPAKVRMDITLTARDPATKDARIIVSQSIRNPQRFPVNFILRYDPDDILPNAEHVITVKLYREQAKEPYLVSRDIPLRGMSGDDPLLIELKPVQPGG